MSRRAPNRYDPDNQHRSYGIKNWLLKINLATTDSGNAIDKEKYKKLINNYCLSKKWKPMKKKLLNEFEQKELFIQNNFATFTKYCKEFGELAVIF